MRWILKAALLLTWWAGWCGMMTPAVAQTSDATAPPDSSQEAVTILLWNRPIAQLRATLAGLSPQARAERVVMRVGALPFRDTAFSVEAMPTQLGDLSGYIIQAGGHIIFGLTSGDLDPESSVSLEEASAQAATQLSTVLKSHIMQTRPAELWQGAVRAGVATLIFLVLSWLLWRLRGYFLARFGAAVHKRGARLLNVDLGPILVHAEAGLIRLVLIALFFAAGYFWLF